MLLKLSNKATAFNVKTQKKYINEDSPYSKAINDAISNYNEFLLYYNLELKEAIVTRPALIKDIDLDLWISCENKTNKELMDDGQSPYAYDSDDGKIELHHIGQNCDSPFAELTTEEHTLYGNNKILHENTSASWRQDESKVLAFHSERALYWKLRAKGNYKVISTKKFGRLEPRDFAQKEDLSSALKVALETLFSEASVEDLNYIGNLSSSYAMVKQIGAKTIEDYINKKSEESDIVCSFCGERNFTLHGNYKSSDEIIKRYKCKKCGKVFTMVSGSIISGSNLSFIEWLRFIDCLYNGFSVNKIAEICELSKPAIQANKYKLFYALKQLDDNIKLTGNIVIDETYRNVSYKGNHADCVILPRKARKRGGECHVSGTSKEKVCIVCALDEDGNSVAKVCGLGNPTAERLDVTLRNVFDKENVISLFSDKESAMKKFAKWNDLPLRSEILLEKGIKNSKKRKPTKEQIIVNNYLQRINSYHSRLNRFLDSFGGISSAHLAGYLYLFTWKERNKHRDKYEAYKELLNVMTERNLHISEYDLCSGAFLPNPFALDKTSKKEFRNQKRADEIYALHAKGLKNVEIAKLYKMTPQGIGRIIRKYDAVNLGYKTEKEKEKERRLMERRPPKGYRANQSEIYIEMYRRRQAWTGTPKSFVEAMMKEFNLSEQTIKNRVCIGKRIVALQDAFFINDTFEYSDLKELYQSIYDEYNKMLKAGVLKTKAKSLLAEKHGFGEANIHRILKIMNSDTELYFNRDIIKTSIAETMNRDKAVFVDYLKWRGSKANFRTWAAEKYGLNPSTIDNILFYCLSADPKRYDMVYATDGSSGKPKI